MAKRINLKNFIKVNMDCTPYLEDYNKLNPHPDSELSIDYHVRAYHPVLYFNGVDVHVPDFDNPEKVGKQLPAYLITKSIKKDLMEAWENC